MHLVLEHKINIPILYLSKHINVNKKEYYDFLNIFLYYDRRVVAYKISKFNCLQFVIETLNEAILKDGNVNGLIIHSDQGSQYTSNQYKEICLANGIQMSMSKKGTIIDDSPMESWHGILKKEALYNNQIKSLDEYILLVEDWIINIK